MSSVNPIFQNIWNADQNKIPPASSVNEINSNIGGFVLNSIEKLKTHGKKEGKLFQAVKIPAEKKQSYDVVTQLFDKYKLDDTKTELRTKDKQDEIDAFLDFVLNTKVMKLAQDYCQYNENDDDWRNFVNSLWFQYFTHKQQKDLSAFEHVFVGEESRQIVEGYHFWYKFSYDEEKLNDLDVQDVYQPESIPTSILLRNTQRVDDDHVIIKKKGGFVLGCSPECLLALGTVAAYAHLNKQNLQAVFDGKLFSIQVFFTPGNDGKQHFRTSYPVYLRTIQQDDNNNNGNDDNNDNDNDNNNDNFNDNDNDNDGQVDGQLKAARRAPPPPQGPTELRMKITGILVNPVGKIDLRLKENQNFSVEIASRLKIVINSQRPLWLKNLDKSKLHYQGSELTITIPEPFSLPKTGGVVRVFDNRRLLDTESYNSAQKAGQWFLFTKMPKTKNRRQEDRSSKL